MWVRKREREREKEREREEERKKERIERDREKERGTERETDRKRMRERERASERGRERDLEKLTDTNHRGRAALPHWHDDKFLEIIKIVERVDAQEGENWKQVFQFVLYWCA